MHAALPARDPATQPARTRRLRLARSLQAATPEAQALAAGGQAPLSDGQAAPSNGQAAPGVSPDAPSGDLLLQEMEANLLRLRQVIRETQALADRMEAYLQGDSSVRFSGGRARKQNPF